MTFESVCGLIVKIMSPEDSLMPFNGRDISNLQNYFHDNNDLLIRFGELQYRDIFKYIEKLSFLIIKVEPIQTLTLNVIISRLDDNFNWIQVGESQITGWTDEQSSIEHHLEYYNIRMREWRKNSKTTLYKYFDIPTVAKIRKWHALYNHIDLKLAPDEIYKPNSSKYFDLLKNIHV